MRLDVGQNLILPVEWHVKTFPIRVSSARNLGRWWAKNWSKALSTPQISHTIFLESASCFWEGLLQASLLHRDHFPDTDLALSTMPILAKIDEISQKFQHLADQA